MLSVHCAYPDMKYPGISFSSFLFCSAGIDFYSKDFFFALHCTKYLLSGSMHSCRDISYFVLSISSALSMLVFHFLFPSYNSRLYTEYSETKGFFFPPPAFFCLKHTFLWFSCWGKKQISDLLILIWRNATV